MAVILDTSAVLGWLERKTPATISALRGIGTTPLIHVVTLGELHEGVARSMAAGAADTDLRQQTIEFVVTRLRRVDDPSEADAECFGWISACTSRKLSHNDKWIVAASIVGGHRLLTEDRRLHAQVMRNDSLAEVVATRGWSGPDVVLVGSDSPQ